MKNPLKNSRGEPAENRLTVRYARCARSTSEPDAILFHVQENRPVPQLWMARSAGQWAAHGDSVYYLPLLTGVMSPPNALLSMRRNFKVVTGFCFMPWERLEFPEYQKSIQSQCMRIALPESSPQVYILYSWRGLDRPRLKFCDLKTRRGETWFLTKRNEIQNIYENNMYNEQNYNSKN